MYLQRWRDRSFQPPTKNNPGYSEKLSGVTATSRVLLGPGKHCAWPLADNAPLTCANNPDLCGLRLLLLGCKLLLKGSDRLFKTLPLGARRRHFLLPAQSRQLHLGTRQQGDSKCEQQLLLPISLLVFSLNRWSVTSCAVLLAVLPL